MLKYSQWKLLLKLDVLKTALGNTTLDSSHRQLVSRNTGPPGYLYLLE
jgi:hypothetical protein